MVKRTSTVLVVTTSRDDAKLISEALEGIGADTCEAGSYREALAFLNRMAVTAIYCDEHLPDGTWKDLYGRIIVCPDAPPVVVIFPQFDESLWAEALNVGARDVLVRPLDATELVHSAQAIMPPVPIGDRGRAAATAGSR